MALAYSIIIKKKPISHFMNKLFKSILGSLPHTSVFKIDIRLDKINIRFTLSIQIKYQTEIG